MMRPAVTQWKWNGSIEATNLNPTSWCKVQRCVCFGAALKYGTMWYGSAGHDMVWYGTERQSNSMQHYSMVQYGKFWYGMV